jgi:type II secretory pathway pseudopilin PulG
MTITLPAARNRALTMVELLVIIGVIAIMAMMVYPGGQKDKDRALRLQCLNNLKQIGLANRVWIGDQGWDYPMRTSTNSGGTREISFGPSAFRSFQVMSNELNTPAVLFCPADSDRERNRASTFDPVPKFEETSFTSNSNLSYFVGIDASENSPSTILSGDRNITNGTPLKKGILELTSKQPGGWTDEIHRKVGNVVLSDGSVQQLSNTGLRNVVTNTGIATNRLQMPVLTP